MVELDYLTGKIHIRFVRIPELFFVFDNRVGLITIKEDEAHISNLWLISRDEMFAYTTFFLL